MVLLPSSLPSVVLPVAVAPGAMPPSPTADGALKVKPSVTVPVTSVVSARAAVGMTSTDTSAKTIPSVNIFFFKVLLL